MARFKDDQHVYSLIGGMFQDVLADETAGSRMRAVGGTVQWDLRRPSARITVRLGEGVEHGVDCGDTGAKPDVVLSMDADTAHRFWAGELPLHAALSRGLIRAKGPVATILRIVPVVGPARELYAARLAGGGQPAAAEEPGETPAVAEAGSDGEAEADASAPVEGQVDAAAEPDGEAQEPAEPEAEADTHAAPEPEAEAPAEPAAQAPEPERGAAEPVRTQPQIENADPEQTPPGEPDVPAGGEEITPP